MIAVNLGPSRLQSIVAGEISREPVGLSPSVFTIRGQGKVSWVPCPSETIHCDVVEPAPSRES